MLHDCAIYIYIAVAIGKNMNYTNSCHMYPCTISIVVGSHNITFAYKLLLQIYTIHIYIIIYLYLYIYIYIYEDIIIS